MLRFLNFIVEAVLLENKAWHQFVGQNAKKLLDRVDFEDKYKTMTDQPGHGTPEHITNFLSARLGLQDVPVEHGRWILKQINQGNMHGEDVGLVKRHLAHLARLQASGKSKAELSKLTSPQVLSDHIHNTDPIGANLDSGDLVPGEYTVHGENEHWIVAQPHTSGAACALGTGSNWCTAGGAFEEYAHHGPLMIYIPKSPRYKRERYQSWTLTDNPQSPRDVYEGDLENGQHMDTNNTPIGYNRRLKFLEHSHGSYTKEGHIPDFSTRPLPEIQDPVAQTQAYKFQLQDKLARFRNGKLSAQEGADFIRGLEETPDNHRYKQMHSQLLGHLTSYAFSEGDEYPEGALDSLRTLERIQKVIDSKVDRKPIPKRNYTPDEREIEDPPHYDPLRMLLEKGSMPKDVGAVLFSPDNIHKILQTDPDTSGLLIRRFSSLRHNADKSVGNHLMHAIITPESYVNVQEHLDKFLKGDRDLLMNFSPEHIKTAIDADSRDASPADSSRFVSILRILQNTNKNPITFKQSEINDNNSEALTYSKKKDSIREYNKKIYHEYEYHEHSKIDPLQLTPEIIDYAISKRPLENMSAMVAHGPIDKLEKRHIDQMFNIGDIEAQKHPDAQMDSWKMPHHHLTSRLGQISQLPSENKYTPQEIFDKYVDRANMPIYQDSIQHILSGNSPISLNKNQYETLRKIDHAGIAHHTYTKAFRSNPELITSDHLEEMLANRRVDHSIAMHHPDFNERHLEEMVRSGTPAGVKIAREIFRPYPSAQSRAITGLPSPDLDRFRTPEMTKKIFEWSGGSQRLPTKDEIEGMAFTAHYNIDPHEAVQAVVDREIQRVQSVGKSYRDRSPNIRLAPYATLSTLPIILNHPNTSTVRESIRNVRYEESKYINKDPEREALLKRVEDEFEAREHREWEEFKAETQARNPYRDQDKV